MSRHPGPYELDSTFLRLGNNASVEPLAVDDGFWEKLGRGEFGDFHNEYLVTSHVFNQDWTSWEMHPNGDEIVCLIEGAVTFVLEQDGAHRELHLDRTGELVIVPRGTWHTARVGEPSRMLFITAGEGTRHREAT